jgi:quercetin dioxygenase-like cupin family protein
MTKTQRYLLLVPQVGLTVCAAFWAAVAWTETSTVEPALARTFQDADLKWGPCPPFLPEGCGIAVVHGDPSKPNVDVFFKVPAGAKIAPHTHTSAERMVLVSGRLEVKYEGQAAQLLKVGSYAYGPAKRVHEATCHKGAPCVLFIAFESPLDAAAYNGEVK